MEVSASPELLRVHIWGLSVGWSGDAEPRARTSSDALAFKVQEAAAE